MPLQMTVQPSISRGIDSTARKLAMYHAGWHLILAVWCVAGEGGVTVVVVVVVGLQRRPSIVPDNIDCSGI